MTHGLLICEWAGRHRAFRLTVPQHFALEQKVGKDVWSLFQCMGAGDVLLREVRQTLVCSLIGGGTPAAEAERVIAGASLRSIAQGMPVALSVLAAALLVPEDDEPDDKGDGAAVTIGNVYQHAFAIGLKPRDLDSMTLWEFGQAARGFMLLHGDGEDVAAPGRDEIASLMERYG